MQTVGVKKEVEPLGRICIPKEMRKLFDLKNEVELVVTSEGILIRNPKYVLVEIKSQTDGK